MRTRRRSLLGHPERVEHILRSRTSTHRRQPEHRHTRPVVEHSEKLLEEAQRHALRDQVLAHGRGRVQDRHQLQRPADRIEPLPRSDRELGAG